MRPLALLVLPALLLRALIPAGFMPAHGAAPALEICPDGFPARLLLRTAHHHDHAAGGGAHGDHCLFGSACGGAPLLQAPQCVDGASPLQVAMPRTTAPALHVRLVHLPHARGPPPGLSQSS